MLVSGFVLLVGPWFLLPSLDLREVVTVIAWWECFCRSERRRGELEKRLREASRKSEGHLVHMKRGCQGVGGVVGGGDAAKTPLVFVVVTYSDL